MPRGVLGSTCPFHLIEEIAMSGDRRPEATIDSDAQHVIGLALRLGGEHAIRQPLPEMFATLLARLHAAESAKAPSASLARDGRAPPLS